MGAAFSAAQGGDPWIGGAGSLIGYLANQFPHNKNPGKITNGKSIWLKSWAKYNFNPDGSAMYLDASTIDFSGITQRDLNYNPKTGTYGLRWFNKKPLSQGGLTFGKLDLVKAGPNSFYIRPDVYDFDVNWRTIYSVRDIATFIGGVVNHFPTGFAPNLFGGPFKVYFVGTATIKP